MGYVTKLREKVGHEPIFICGCGVLIFNEKSQVVLQRRSDDNTGGNPGGSMELGETIYETAIRETFEETNLEIEKKDLKLFKIYSGEEGHHIYPNNDEAYIISIMFETNVYKGNLKLDKDHESLELKFFDIDNLPDDLNNLFKYVARDLKLRESGEKEWKKITMRKI